MKEKNNEITYLVTEKIQINRNHKLYKEMDNLCFRAKNLYNAALYQMKKENEETGKLPQVRKVRDRFTAEKQPDMFALPSDIAGNVFEKLGDNWKSFFKSLKEWKKNPGKYKAMPRPPRFLHKTEGRQLIESEPNKSSFGTFSFGISNARAVKGRCEKIIIRTHNMISFGAKFRVIPRKDYYKIEILSKVQSPELLPDNGRYAAIDLGVNNLCTIANNCCLSCVIINGRNIKSINQYSNKTTAKLKSLIHPDAKGRQKSSKAIRAQLLKRHNKLEDYMHKVSKYIVEWAVKNEICSIAIGENKGWKQEINLGSKTNQTFTHIPFDRLKQKIEYKARMHGITVVYNEESYTSKCSAIDNEPVKKSESYMGKRVKRGLFRSREGILINADINGAHNIGRKSFGEIWKFQKEWLNLRIIKIRYLN